MKQVYLCALLLAVVGVSATAAEIDTDHLMFPEDVAEAIAIAESREVLSAGDVRMVDQNDYVEGKPWVGATKVGEEAQNQQQTKELNRRFVED